MEGLLALAVYCITLIRERHGHLGTHDVARLLSRLVFNPLSPILGGDKRELGTPQTPAAFCCTVPCHSRGGGNLESCWPGLPGPVSLMYHTS